MNHSTRRLVPGALAAVLLLGGCATAIQDSGFKTVADVARDRLGKDATWQRSPEARDSAAQRTRELLAQPVTMDGAVQIALLNNRGLQASYAELGLSEAALVQASRLPNPGFSFKRTRSGDDLSIERTFSLSFLSLLTLPVAARIEGRYFAQTKLLVANQMLQVAADTRRAYVNAVAAEQSARYAEQVQQAAEAGAEFAKRLAAAGNFSKLDRAREQAFYAEATANLARMRQQAQAEREALIRHLGVWGADTGFKLPERLPDLPKERPELQQIEAYALRNRLDIQAGKLQVDGLASSLGLTKATRFINVLDLGYVRNSKTGEPRETGYEIGIEIPLFDWGGARVARAQAIYMQAADQLADTAVRARSEARESYVRYQTAYDLTRHYRDEVVPVRKTISDEMLLRYNGMLVSVFELLADAREQVNAVNGYIDALRGYWLAQTDLQMALGGKLPPVEAEASSQSQGH
ncbi:TolC family protein [Ralstonia insidiosa]|uniref:TolC family protein n=1 Tax=Ralstonia insidiosa TaxID=190721 RepID=A0A848PB79_9RALS|nr:TolC family protein [Ralstonia insidiosa]NMV40788.1 TolC family protein [Ralstonia insidiosa]